MFIRRKAKIPRLLAFWFFCGAKRLCLYRHAGWRPVCHDGHGYQRGAVLADEFESASGESYVLQRVSGATGVFVGQVREEYVCVLARIVG